MNLLFLFFATTVGAQNNNVITTKQNVNNNFITSESNLTMEAAFEFVNRSTRIADSLNKKIAVAILDKSGTIIILVRGDGVGPHNLEAARRKAYTALSTKTTTLTLLRNSNRNDDIKNLNTLPELLLLSGGVPLYYKGDVIGSIGIAGGGSPENDDAIAKSAIIPEIGLTTNK